MENYQQNYAAQMKKKVKDFIPQINNMILSEKNAKIVKTTKLEDKKNKNKKS